VIFFQQLRAPLVERRSLPDNLGHPAPGVGLLGEREKAEVAFAEYLIKNRQPFFGDGHPHQVLIGDCLAIYCEKHGPTVARPKGLAFEIDRLAEFFEESSRR